jgi:hypothetical protein
VRREKSWIFSPLRRGIRAGEQGSPIDLNGLKIRLIFDSAAAARRKDEDTGTEEKEATRLGSRRLQQGPPVARASLGRGAFHSATGNAGKPSSFRNALCFAVAVWIAPSISTKPAWVASRLISSSPTAVLM